MDLRSSRRKDIDVNYEAEANKSIHSDWKLISRFFSPLVRSSSIFFDLLMNINARKLTSALEPRKASSSWYRFSFCSFSFAQLIVWKVFLRVLVLVFCLINKTQKRWVRPEILPGMSLTFLFLVLFQSRQSQAVESLRGADLVQAPPRRWPPHQAAPSKT